MVVSQRPGSTSFSDFTWKPGIGMLRAKTEVPNVLDS